MRPLAPLFPNLRTLHWSRPVFPDRHLPAFISLLGASVSTVKLVTAWKSFDTGVLRSSLSLLAERCPNIERLAVKRTMKSDPLLLSSLPIYLREFRSLVSFESGDKVPLTVACILALGKLSALESCEIRLPSAEQWSSALAVVDFFSTLVDIVIFASVKDYVAFGQIVTLASVRRFTLSLTNETLNGNDIPMLFTTLRFQLNPDNLVALAVEQLSFDSRLLQEAGRTVLTDHFTPLFDFPLLNRFQFSPPWMYDIDNVLLRDMAKAWPNLNSFVLASHPYSTFVQPSRLTLRALPPFALHCPHLQTLTLRLDAETGHVGGRALEPFYQDLEDFPRGSQSILTSLSIAECSPIAGPENVAAFLSCVFPNLESVEYQGSAVTGGADSAAERYWLGWEMVNRLMPVLCQVRTHERKICMGA